MSVHNVPVIAQVLDSGADDRVFDALLLAGPLVIVLIAALGRTPLTLGVALAYIGLFVTQILYKAIAEP